MAHVIGTKGLTLEELDAILSSDAHIALSPEAEQRVKVSHDWLQRADLWGEHRLRRPGGPAH
jgi:hypothetical protein